MPRKRASRRRHTSRRRHASQERLLRRIFRYFGRLFPLPRAQACTLRVRQALHGSARSAPFRDQRAVHLWAFMKAYQISSQLAPERADQQARLLRHEGGLSREELALLLGELALKRRSSGPSRPAR